MPKNKKLALKLGIQTYQILANDDEVCIPSLSSVLLAVKNVWPSVPWGYSCHLSSKVTIHCIARSHFNISEVQCNMEKENHTTSLLYLA